MSARDPNHPPRRFVGAGEKHAQHMEPYGDHHAWAAQRCMLRRTSRTARRIQVFHIQIGVLTHWPVVEHQITPVKVSTRKSKKEIPPMHQVKRMRTP
jgi:hypothetical protein